MKTFNYSILTMPENKIIKLSLILFSLFIFQSVNANHIMGADITYRVLDTSLTTITYRFTVSVYRDCAGITNVSSSLYIRSSSESVIVPMTLVKKEEATPICLPPDVAVKPTTNCPGMTPVGSNGIKGVEKVVYTRDYTFQRNKGPAYVGFYDFCRNDIISTISPTCVGLWVQALFNTNYINNSTVFTTPPIPYWCKLTLNTYNHGSIDSFDPHYIVVNGQTVIRDSISYTTYAPFVNEAANINDAANLLNPGVTFNAPLNATNFLYTTSGVTIDPKTGSITCIPSVSQDAIMAMAVKEWRAVPNSNGIGYKRVEIGYVCRDIQFTVRDKCDPITDPGVIEDSLVSANFIDVDKVDICGSSSTQVTFKIVGALAQYMKYKIVQTPNDSAVFNFKFRGNMVRAANVDTLFGTITFDSTRGIGTEYFKLEAYYCTNIGITIRKYYTLTINFRPSVKTNKTILYYCIDGKPVKSIVKGGTKYRWTPKTGIVGASGIDSVWVNLAPLVTTTYVARAIDGIDSTKSCSVIDSVKVIVIPKFNYTLTPKVSNLCLHDTFQINLSTQITDTPYKYTWYDPTIGSLFDANNKRASTISSPKGVVVGTANYVVDMESRFGCILTDSVKVNMNGVRPNPKATSARNLVCPGDTTKLSASISPKTCGPSVYKTNGVLTPIEMPNTIPRLYPTTCVSGTPSSCYPNPYSTLGTGQSSVTRIIYTKAQLLASGLKAGTIRSISFNISNASNNAFDQFEIRMAGTSSLNAAIDMPTFTVFNPKAIACTGGWNKYTLDRGFDWDGECNLVVETHVSHNSILLAPNTYIALNGIGGNQVVYKYSNTVGVKAENDPSAVWVGSGANSTKPQIRLDYTGIDSSEVPLLAAIWSPAAAIKTAGYTNPQAEATANQKDSIFTVKVGTSQCFDTNSVIVKIDTNFRVKASGDTVLCRQVGVTPVISLKSTITSPVGTTITWTSIPVDPSLTVTNTANTTVSPSGKGTWKYIVKATNAPCTATDTVTVTINDSLEFSLKIDSPLCTSSTGRLQAILPAGGLASQYNFTWTPNPSGSTNDTLKGLAANTYTLLMTLKTDATCKGTKTTVLAPKTVVLNIKDTSSGIKCNGGTADSVWAIVNSPESVGPYSYSWSSNPAIDTFYKLTNKLAGNYTVTVTDKITGCTGTSTYALIQPTPLTVTKDYVTDVKCKGENSGGLKVIASGGTLNGGSYIYQWTSNEAGQPLPNFNEIPTLYADSMTVTVTDIQGCTATLGLRIKEPATGIGLTMSKVEPSTVTALDGMAIGVATGGNPNYTFTWKSPNRVANNVVSVDTFKNRGKGTYYLTVTDNKGCIISDSVKIFGIICNMKYDYLTTDIDCYGASTGKIKFAAIDSINYAATTNYTYTLNGLSSQSFANDRGIDTARFNTLPSGLYNVRIQTSKGCDTLITGILIDQNSQIQTSVPNPIPPSCKGYCDGEAHAVVVDPFAPFTYEWGANPVTSDSFTKTACSGNNQSYVVINSLGCRQSATYDIQPTLGITASYVLTDSIKCHSNTNGEGQINIVENFATPFSYHFKPGSNTDTLSPLLRGLGADTTKRVVIYYKLTPTSKQCSDTVRIKMTEPDTLLLTVPTTINPRCSYINDGQINAVKTGGNTGNVTFELTSVFPTQTSVKASQHNFINLDSGLYHVKVTDRKGCTDTVTNLQLKQPDTFIAFISAVDANCAEIANGQVTVTSTTGGTNPVPANGYQWKNVTTGATLAATTNPLNNIKGLNTYEVTVTDARGCIAKKSIYVDTLYKLRIAAKQVDSANCNGGTDGKIEIQTITPSTAPTPYTYTFSGGVQSGTNPAIMTGGAGTYTITVTDNVGCTDTEVATIEEPAAIVILGTPYDADCYAASTGSIKVTASGGHSPYNYEWIDATPTQFSDSAIGLPAGTYTVQVRDARACLKTQAFTIQQPAEFSAKMGHVKNITCFAANDGELSVVLKGGVYKYTYKWNTDTANKDSARVNLTPNSYRVTVTDANGCTAITQSPITEPLKLEYETIKVDSISCPHYTDGAIDISVKGGTISLAKQYEYSIDGGTTYVVGNKFPNLPAGIYNVIVRDNNNCLAARKVEVISPEELYVTAHRQRTDSIKMGDVEVLSYTGQTASGALPTINKVVWTPYTGLSCSECASPQATPYVSTKYNLEVRYHKNCLATSNIIVPVLAPLDFFVPSAFTPGNGDGVNDILYVYGSGIKKVKFAVFNRWGEKVYESDNMTQGWNGYYKGELQQTGIFSYFAEVHYLNGDIKNKQGSISLIR